jgi:integrase
LIAWFILLDKIEIIKLILIGLEARDYACSPEGQMVRPQNLRRRAWFPALIKANIPFREMKQTRHSFASIALICGASPLWIAQTMGHRDTDMIIRVYGKYVENVSGSVDGSMLNAVYDSTMGNREESQAE